MVRPRDPETGRFTPKPRTATACACGEPIRNPETSTCLKCGLRLWEASERGRAWRRRYRADHREKIREQQRAFQAAHVGYKGRKQKQYATRLRAQVLAAYGQTCACCGEREEAFLQIDHVNGGGREHRRQIGNDIAIYRAVRDEGFPPTYRLLCANCNFVSRFGRSCPHEEARLAEALLMA
jgi:hypothetical protein